MPPPSPYLVARREARRRMLTLDQRTGRRIRVLLEEFANRLGAALEGLPRDQAGAIQASEEIVRFLTRRLEEEMVRTAEEARGLSFRTTRQLWLEAAERVAARNDVPGAVMGAIRVPPITFLGAFEAMGADRSWKTLLRGHMRAAAREVQAIIAQGITEGMGPREVSRRIRRYMQGAEGLQDLVEGGTIDLRKVDQAFRGAAQRAAFNADRLAFTEIHSARHEAEVQHLYNDPFVQANEWRLSPNRGSARVPDGCDWIAEADYYGLGRGIYPVHATPSLVHPFDRCEIIPVSRPLADLAKSKPSPGRMRSPKDVTVRGANKLSEKAARRAREDATKAIVLGESVTRQATRRAA